MVHYNFFESLTHDQNWQKLSLAILIAGVLAIIGKTLSSRLKSEAQIDSAVVPSERITLFGFFDFFVESFIKFQDSILGKENRRYLTFTGTIFIFLLVSNLMGLIPGMPAVTTTVWINVGLAFCVFVFFNNAL